MADSRSMTACVVDQGLFCEFARTLSPSFKRVFYWTPWMNAFPRSNIMLVGVGVDGIEKIKDFWPILDEIDIFIFLDVNFGPLQVYLRSIGKLVWGSGEGEALELDRDWSKKTSLELGIDIGRYSVVTGIDALREYLKDNEDVFVKVSLTRGDFETFHSITYKLSEPKLDELEWALGAKKKVMEFIVEDAINDAIEVGYDGFTIDGHFAKSAMFGIEVKDVGYVAEAGVPYSRLPKCLSSVNKKLGPVFDVYNYRGFFSSEIRATQDGKAYLIDPCARLGSPPGELFGIMVSNWADVIVEGAAGTVVEPEYTGKFGAELLIHSSWADKNWQSISFPPGLREFVKLRNLTVIEGAYYVAPQSVGLPEIGAVVATGETMDEAIKTVIDRAQKIEGYYVQTFPASLDEATAAYDAVKTLKE